MVIYVAAVRLGWFCGDGAVSAFQFVGNCQVDVTCITGSGAGGRDDSAGIHGQVSDIDVDAPSMTCTRRGWADFAGI